MSRNCNCQNAFPFLKSLRCACTFAYLSVFFNKFAIYFYFITVRKMILSAGGTKDQSNLDRTFLHLQFNIFLVKKSFSSKLRLKNRISVYKVFLHLEQIFILLSRFSGSSRDLWWPKYTLKPLFCICNIFNAILL